MKDIYYVNSAGVKLDLLNPPYLLQAGELFNYDWNFTSTNTSLNGGRIDSFTKGIEQRPLKLSIINYGKHSYYAAIDRFYETVDYDVMHKSPGKLFFGDYYLLCYLTSSKKTEWESDSSFLDNEVTLTVEHPFWIKEEKHSFYANSDKNETENIGLNYPFEYPYEYSGQRNLQYLRNDHFVECGFRMIFFGPRINPYIRIGGHLYEVQTTLYDGEYLTIDTTSESIIKTKVSGETENLFNSRNKDSYIWAKIPAGKQTITWPGDFGVDIFLLYERGEPPWNS